ncbi:hypothetical protein AVEN_212369-1 [Araneus ventricosus]|uniref:Uncharacterized protein n=1 Tax=Araneus ventricosus TaxID=182803 RepID=A0A4Y2N577_ARAVE|nr:hypothetical protein AVEN_212369-1 [Araneus ventricosus]
MIPYFHAQDIFLNAKSGQLFVQDMENLGNTMDADTLKNFTEDFFTVRQSEKSFSRTSSEIEIEQLLMKSSKMQGGFGHGRSTKESVLNKFVVGLLSASNISEGLENFCGLSFVSGEQHVNVQESPSQMRPRRRQEIIKVVLRSQSFSKCTSDHIYSNWNYRQCGKDKLLRCTEHWSNYDVKKVASRNEISFNDYRYRYFTKAMTKK